MSAQPNRQNSIVFAANMFALHLRRIYYSCDKVIVRNLRSRRSDRGPPNPGLQRRLQAFQEDGLKIQDDDAEEFVEQSESDFYKVGDAYTAHLNETLMGKLDLRRNVIKQKYFKESMPNLLTWSEKEQIRHLATQSPDEWTPEKIAESFPVTVAVAKKLLKYPWKPASEQRIARHDASAMRNWKELKDGTLDIPEDLRNHFLKFSERSIPPLNRQSFKIDLTQTEDIGEFERIVKRCAAKDEKKEQRTDFTSTDQDSSEHSENKVKKDIKRVTLEELTAKIKKRMEKGNKLDIPDKIMLNTVDNNVSEITPAELNKEIDLLVEENKQKELTHFSEKDKKITVPDYPERIRIPKKAYKAGATYKVNDCYYDHDGRFLYRVIGMSN